MSCYVMSTSLFIYSLFIASRLSTQVHGYSLPRMDKA